MHHEVLDAKNVQAADGQRPPIADGCYPAIKELMEQCWHADPKERPPPLRLLASLAKVASLLNH